MSAKFRNIRKRFSEVFTQGGQTELHNFHMIRQVVSTTLKISLALGFIFFIFMLLSRCGLDQVYFLLAFNKAFFRMQLSSLPKGFFDSSWVPFSKGNWQEIDDYLLVNTEAYLIFAEIIKIKVAQTAFFSICFFCFSFLVLSLYWIYRGRKRQETKVLKGYELVDPKHLKRLIIQSGASPICIENIPLPVNAECEHLMIAGTTGSGKTNSLYALLKQIRSLGHQAVVVDTSGNFVARFFEEKKDILLNPFDARAHHWDLWQECCEDYEFDEFAESFVPTEGYDKFWTKASQQLFATAALEMKKSNKNSIEELLHDLLTRPLKELAIHFKDTLVSAYVDPAVEKTALGIRATLVSAVKSLKYLEKNARSFSIRNWIQTEHNKDVGSQKDSSETQEEETKGWLFLSALPTQRETLKPLLSAWLSIAVKSLMSSGENLNRRVWFIIDELASLNRIPILMQGLSEARRYGGCFVLSFQDLHQLDTLYGTHTARTLGSLTGTKIVFRMDSFGAKQMSDLFGEQETIEPNESISFGAHQMREGVSLTEYQKTRPLLSPADLMKLDNFEAYLKYPRNLPATKLKFTLQETPTITVPFKPKMEISAVKSENITKNNAPLTSNEESLKPHKDLVESQTLPQNSSKKSALPLKKLPVKANLSSDILESSSQKEKVDEEVFCSDA